MGKLESRIDFRLRGYGGCLKTIARFSLDLKDNCCINGEAVTMLGNSGRPGVRRRDRCFVHRDQKRDLTSHERKMTNQS
jgi:hypothetical protein